MDSLDMDSLDMAASIERPGRHFVERPCEQNFQHKYAEKSY